MGTFHTLLRPGLQFCWFWTGRFVFWNPDQKPKPERACLPGKYCIPVSRRVLTYWISPQQHPLLHERVFQCLKRVNFNLKQKLGDTCSFREKRPTQEHIEMINCSKQYTKHSYVKMNRFLFRNLYRTVTNLREISGSVKNFEKQGILSWMYIPHIQPASGPNCCNVYCYKLRWLFSLDLSNYTYEILSLKQTRLAWVNSFWYFNFNFNFN